MTAFEADRGIDTRGGSTGLMAILAAVTMLFAALASAYVVRRGMSADWTPLPLSGTTALISVLPLLITTVALTIASRTNAPRRGMWLAVGTTMAAVFITSHIYMWLQLRIGGISLSTGPSAAFFFVLTAAYQCCATGGLILLVSLLTLRAESGLKGLSYYWQYLTILWLSLLLLMYLLP